MKRLNIFTNKYEGELRDFAARASAAGILLIRGSGFCENRQVYGLKITVLDVKALPEVLTSLLMDITEAENAVYKYSQKLRTMAATARLTSIHDREVKQLKLFLAENKTLHLEGYVTFRLGEYRDKLDMMIYSLIKKIKFGTGD